MVSLLWAGCPLMTYSPRQSQCLEKLCPDWTLCVGQPGVYPSPAVGNEWG